MWSLPSPAPSLTLPHLCFSNGGGYFTFQLRLEVIGETDGERTESQSSSKLGCCEEDARCSCESTRKLGTNSVYFWIEFGAPT